MASFANFKFEGALFSKSMYTRGFTEFGIKVA